MIKVKDPASLDIHINYLGWFRYKITTVYYNEFGEDYAHGEEYGFGIKETENIIYNNVLWAIKKRNMTMDTIHIINNTDKFFKKIKISC